MANPHKGEVAIEALGQSWRLVLNTYGLAAAERHIGQPLTRVMADGNNVGFNVILGVFYGGLQTHHDNTPVKKAAAIIDEIGIERASELFAEAVALAFPNAKADSENPPKAKD